MNKNSSRETAADQLMRNYIVGFVWAVVLTVIPFGMVMAGNFSRPLLFTVIALCGTAQMLVHLRYFLHLSFHGDARSNTLVFAFTGIMVFLMMGGSFWIMYDTHNRMMILP